MLRNPADLQLRGPIGCRWFAVFRTLPRILCGLASALSVDLPQEPCQPPPSFRMHRQHVDDVDPWSSSRRGVTILDVGAIYERVFLPPLGHIEWGRTLGAPWEGRVALSPGAPGTGPIPVYSRLAPDDHRQRVSFHSASISPSNRATFRRASGCIVSMSMMSAQSSPCPSR